MHTQENAAPSLHVAGMCERDIDLLLLEEFHSSQAFQRWFLSQILENEPSNGARLLSAEHSIHDSEGESDLRIFFELEKSRKILFLIENKLTASFQPNQADRYQQRGISYCKNARCDEFYSVLIAPARYFGDQISLRGFDRKLSYEQLVDWFSRRGHRDARARYKVLFLKAASEKATLGYQPVADQPVTTFWRNYWFTAERIAPRLLMPEPGPKPARAGFVRFRPAVLPRGIELIHKLRHGFVDLQFNGKAASLERLRRNSMPVNARVVRANKSVAVRVSVGSVNAGRGFEGQESIVQKSLAVALTLLDWYVETKPNLESI